MKLLKILILTLSVVSIKGSLFCQNNCMYASTIRSLDESRNYRDSIAYIVYDSTLISNNTLTVFLVNNTDSILQAKGYNCRVEFGMEASAIDGRWQVLDFRNDRWCGTGYGKFNIPPRHYTSEKIYLGDLDGNYETTVRFTYAAGNDTIRSEPFTMAIDSLLIGSDYDKYIRSIDKLIDGETEKEKIDKYRIVKAKYFIVTNQLVAADKLLSSPMNQPLLSDDVKYLTALYYAKLLEKLHATFTKVEIIAVVSQIINLFKEIPETHPSYQSGQRAIEIYSEILITENEWIKINDLKCSIIDGKYHCYVGKFLDRYVLINFK